jgi:hypothetical protein
MNIHCSSQKRRLKLFNSLEWNGVDFVEVASDQKSICLHFFGSVPENIKVRNVRISGGRRITDVRIVDVRTELAHDDDLDDCLHITFNKPGDFSTYTICIVDDEGNPFLRLDPRYARIEFSFKVDCPSDIDCKPELECPPVIFDEPDINYLAKDYASFRQLIYDRLSLTISDWRERHVPDIGVTLVEVLAYAADHLSYYQDAVATEAYLETARLRTSIRRHLRLIDYQLSEGLNARALVTMWVSSDILLPSVDSFFFITGFDGLMLRGGRSIDATSLQGIPGTNFEAFEVDRRNHPSELHFHAAHNEIEIYTWGDDQCCLDKGATHATLLDTGYRTEEGTARALCLKTGDIVVFEEVLGSKSGVEADANPTHRHAVRLTRCTKSQDALLGHLVLDIEWAVEDALPFSFCLSSRRPPPDCDTIRNITVVRGNIVVCSHGHTRVDVLGPVDSSVMVADCACEGSVVEAQIIAAKFQPLLERGPLVFSDDIPVSGPVTEVFQRDPFVAMPDLSLTSKLTKQTWSARAALLGDGPESKVFVAECDDDGKATLRFGDGMNGQAPEVGEIFDATYRVAHCSQGNVGCDTINTVVFRDISFNSVTILPRNPLSASGGVAPESVERAKMIAPGLLRTRRERAITASDYAELAQRNSKLQGATATLRWTGSWREASVTIDPLHTDEVQPVLMDAVKSELEKFRRMGHDLSVRAAKYVALDLEITVCVLPHIARTDVLRDLKRAFSSRVGGMFEPDKLVLGGGVRLSRVVAVAQALDGVQMVRVNRLDRQGTASNRSIDSGIVPMSPLEIAQIDNDPDFPEHGRCSFKLGGGR